MGSAADLRLALEALFPSISEPATSLSRHLTDPNPLQHQALASWFHLPHRLLHVQLDAHLVHIGFLWDLAPDHRPLPLDLDLRLLSLERGARLSPAARFSSCGP